MSEKKFRKIEDLIEESKKALPITVVEYIEECKKEEYSESLLIAVLHKLQAYDGYLEAKKLEAIAQLMQIPAAKVSGVASFYHFFRLKPVGKYIISVCMGTACHVKGAGLILNKIKEYLGIEVGETSKNGLFTLEEAHCLGTCALAPVLKIGESVYAQVTVDQVPAILEGYMKNHEPLA